MVSQFAEVDLHPDQVSNAEMGDLFEHLIYKFAEASNEEVGEHYTPRDAIRLMVDLLFAEDNEAPARTRHGPHDLRPHRRYRRDALGRGRSGYSNATKTRGCGCTGRRSTTSPTRFASPT